jgi:hypothetical protein
MKVKSTNRLITNALIYELCNNGDYRFCVYTATDSDRTIEVDGEEVKLLSLKNIFLEMEDLTEYEFALHCFTSWGQWQRIQKSKIKYMSTPFCDVVEGWREELELKLRARALRQIADYATTDKGYQAAKFMADRGWDLRKAGAPSKAEQTKRAKQDKMLHDSVTEDLERMGMIEH